MSTRVVHLLRCDMPNCGGELIPHDGSTVTATRAEAKKLGDWRRIHVKGGPGSPSHWADVCPNHKSSSEEQTHG